LEGRVGLDSLQGHPDGGYMLWTIFGVLLTLWLLGIVSANTFGGFIHVLLWAAIAVVLLGVLQGRQRMS
jgi:hypothetical protein